MTKIYRPINYDPNPCEFMVYVEPEPEITDKQNLMYVYCNTNYKYAHYWSNNWRKTHGYPLKRKQLNKKPVIYLKPEISDY